MKWAELPKSTRYWMDFLGDFSPTVHEDARELKGGMADKEGNVERVYLCANDLRQLASACQDAADWLDKRAELNQSE